MKKQTKIILIVLAVIIVLGTIGRMSSRNKDDNATTAANVTEVPKDTAEESNTEATLIPTEAPEAEPTEAPEAEPTEAPKDDFSDVKTSYELSAGNYTAGIDLPLGTCNITAVSGDGNAHSSNLFSGGINEMIGTSGDPYSKEFKGLEMSSDVVLSLSGRLKIKVEYTNITGDYTPRSYDKSKSIKLSSGNYTVGSDINAGVYNLKAISDNGNISSSNMFDGGINEMIGTESSLYIKTFKNLILNDGDTIKLSGGVKVEFIPSK